MVGVDLQFAGLSDRVSLGLATLLAIEAGRNISVGGE